MDRVKKILRPNRIVPDQKETALNTVLYCSHHLYLIPVIGQNLKKKKKDTRSSLCSCFQGKNYSEASI